MMDLSYIFFAENPASRYRPGSDSASISFRTADVQYLTARYIAYVNLDDNYAYCTYFAPGDPYVNINILNGMYTLENMQVCVDQLQAAVL